MTDMSDLTDQDLEILEEKLGVNLSGTQVVANDVKSYFVKRCDEEDLQYDEMITAWRAVDDMIEDAFQEALGETTK